MTNRRHRLLTRRIAPGLYQHELFYNGKKIDYTQLPKEIIEIADKMGRRDAQILENDNQNELELVIGIGSEF